MREKQGHVPLSVSQNFLTSTETIARLIAIARLNGAERVVEIGAGKGHITRALAAACKEVISYEIDPRLCARLRGRLSGNVRLICGDFLEARLPRGPYRVFANIPFSRTTEIVRKLTGGERPPEESWLIMEKGAAKRFCGKPRESLQSLLLKPFFDAEIRYYFRREEFHPAPRVDIALLHLSRRPRPDIALRERGSYERFLRVGLRDGFRGPGRLLSARQARSVLKAAGLPVCERSGLMRYVQWLCLFRWWSRQGDRRGEGGPDA